MSNISSHRIADIRGRKHFTEDFGRFYITAGTEDDYDRTDILATAVTNPNKIYTIEIKSYDNKDFPRPYEKYTKQGIDYGYQVDYDKIDYLMRMWENEGRIPILYAHFTDITLVWDLRKIPYKERKKLKWVNKDGQNYHKYTELAWQTYLYRDEAILEKISN